MRTRTWILTVIAGALLCLSTASPASACPMCKLANESDSRLPTAYMYSILFMLGMPATVLSGFSVGFWRLSRKAARLQREAAEHAVLSAADPAVEAIQSPEPAFSPSAQALPGAGVVGPGLVFP